MATRPHGSGIPEPFQHLKTKPLEIADLLIAYLEQLGVEYVFGIPGGAIEPLYNALARSERHGGPRAIVARHENGAAFMAHGYYMGKRRLGVCCATTGPGATNLLTGVATAYENSIPMLVLTAQTALSSFGKGAFQESSDTGVNTLGMFEHCTNYNTLVSHPNQFEQKLYSAVMTAFQTMTPSHLSVPLDIFRSTVPMSKPSFDLLHASEPHNWAHTDSLDTFCRTLLDSKNIVFVIGDNCSDAIGTILDVAFLVDAKIVTTPHGKGLVSPYHPLFRGVVGFAGHQSALQLLGDPTVDLIVAIGTNLSEWASNNWDHGVLMNEKLIHVEACERFFTRSPMARLHVHGKIDFVFELLLAHELMADKIRFRQAHIQEVHHAPPETEHSGSLHIDKRFFRLDSEEKYMDDSAPIKPQRLMLELGRLFPPQTCFMADVGNSFSWSVHYLHPYDRRIAGKRKRGYGVYHSCFEFAPMGWAIGSSIGFAMARPGIPIICITGDGSVLMNGQEITVALQHKLNVIYVVLNDGALGMVKHGQIMNNAERVGYELPKVDYCALAKAMGVNGCIINSPADLLALDIKKICSSSAPVLLDVRIDPNEPPPMMSRVKALGPVAV
ncbi:MAG TPA: thiamine pyrophosphate-binding protein [Gammaproteobacteria bacterium]